MRDTGFCSQRCAEQQAREDAASARDERSAVTREEVLARLKALLDSPPIQLTVSGGGLAEPVSVSPANAVIVSRAEVADIIAVLQGEPE
jgi:hypothetical protein